MKLKANEVATRLGSWAFVRAQNWCLRRDPESAARGGAKIGRLAFRLSKKHRERTLSNLALAFPEWDDPTRHQTAIRVFEHFGSIATDFLRTEIRTASDLLDNTEVVGYEHLQDALSLGKGILAITCHLGNWERAAHWFCIKGHPMSVVARDANDSELNNLVLRMRHAAGAEVIPRGNAARPILSRLRDNKIVAILPDQNSDEAYVPFFGKMAGTVQGPAVIHFRTGAPLVPLACYSAGVGKLRIELLEPIVVPRGRGTSAEELTARLNQVIESMIRKAPDQYLWLHDRWKNARRRGLL